MATWNTQQGPASSDFKHLKNPSDITGEVDSYLRDLARVASDPVFAGQQRAYTTKDAQGQSVYKFGTNQERVQSWLASKTGDASTGLLETARTVAHQRNAVETNRFMDGVRQRVSGGPNGPAGNAAAVVVGAAQAAPGAAPVPVAAPAAGAAPAPRSEFAWKDTLASYMKDVHPGTGANFTGPAYRGENNPGGTNFVGPAMAPASAPNLSGKVEVRPGIFLDPNSPVAKRMMSTETAKAVSGVAQRQLVSSVSVGGSSVSDYWNNATGQNETEASGPESARGYLSSINQGELGALGGVKFTPTAQRRPLTPQMPSMDSIAGIPTVQTPAKATPQLSLNELFPPNPYAAYQGSAPPPRRRFSSYVNELNRSL